MAVSTGLKFLDFTKSNTYEHNNTSHNYRMNDTNNNNNYIRNNYCKSKNGHRKIICFDPPFCNISSINIGKCLLILIDKYFNKPVSKIFNRKTLKISNLCTKIMSKIIYNHHKKITDQLKLEK